MLNQECIQEFKKKWLLEYGREIDDKVAEKIATKLLTMMRAVYKPIRTSDTELLKKYEKNNK